MQYSSHLHENLQQLDTAAEERRHGFVSHPNILHINNQTQLLEFFPT